MFYKVFDNIYDKLKTPIKLVFIGENNVFEDLENSMDEMTFEQLECMPIAYFFEVKNNIRLRGIIKY